jgi:RNA polymerase sigma-70 factor, ECF subfamily
LTKPFSQRRSVTNVANTATLSHTLAVVHELPQTLDLDGLFRAHYGRLVRALTVVSGSREAAADAVQEAFVKAHLKWRVVSHYDDPVGWIRRVAINKLRDEHRSSGRKQKLVDRIGAEPERMIAEPELDELGAHLATLPRQQRLAIALFYIDQLSITEVAEALGISAGAVKFHLHQGRERLRGTLLGEGDPS